MSNYRKQPHRIRKRTRRRTSLGNDVNSNSPALKDKPDICTQPTLATRIPTANPSKQGVTHRPFAYRLMPALLRDFDDIATDLLIDSVYFEVTVRKANSAYSSTCKNRKDIVSIIKNVVIKQNAPATAVSLLLQVPDLATFLDSLGSAEDKESFQKHIRKYVDIYLPDCPFEVSRTTRYTSEPEAAIKARKDIEKGKIIYLGGTQASSSEKTHPTGVTSALRSQAVTKSCLEKIYMDLCGLKQCNRGIITLENFQVALLERIPNSVTAFQKAVMGRPIE